MSTVSLVARDAFFKVVSPLVLKVEDPSHPFLKRRLHGPGAAVNTKGGELPFAAPRANGSYGQHGPGNSWSSPLSLTVVFSAFLMGGSVYLWTA